MPPSIIVIDAGDHSRMYSRQRCPPGLLLTTSSGSSWSSMNPTIINGSIPAVIETRCTKTPPATRGALVHHNNKIHHHHHNSKYHHHHHNCMTIPLQRVDSTSTAFHSLDGLFLNSYSLVRSELRQKLQPRYQSLLLRQQQQQKHQQRTSFSPTTNHLRKQRYRAELSQLKRRLDNPRVSSTHHHDHHGRSRRSSSSRRPHPPPPGTAKQKHGKTVRFCTPVVTQVLYRPYTPTRDIAKLFFQEDELNLLEEDRSQDPGDIVECALVEHASYRNAMFAVAYQRRTSVDD